MLRRTRDRVAILPPQLLVVLPDARKDLVGRMAKIDGHSPPLVGGGPRRDLLELLELAGIARQLHENVLHRLSCAQFRLVPHALLDLGNDRFYVGRFLRGRCRRAFSRRSVAHDDRAVGDEPLQRADIGKDGKLTRNPEDLRRGERPVPRVLDRPKRLHEQRTLVFDAAALERELQRLDLPGECLSFETERACPRTEVLSGRLELRPVGPRSTIMIAHRYSWAKDITKANSVRRIGRRPKFVANPD